MCVCVTDQRPSDHSQAGCTCRTCLNFIMKHSNRQIHGWMDGWADGQSVELEDLYTNIYRLIYRFRFCCIVFYTCTIYTYICTAPASHLKFTVAAYPNQTRVSQPTNLPA